MYMYMYVCVCVCVHVCIQEGIHVYVCICVSMGTCIHVQCMCGGVYGGLMYMYVTIINYKFIMTHINCDLIFKL